MDGLLFTGGTVKKGDVLYCTCHVKYPSELDSFLPSHLTMRTDGPWVSIEAFSGGEGSFEADSLEHAEETESEIKTVLETAYNDMLGMQWRIDQWSGVREYSLAPEEKSVPESTRQADAGETVSFEEVMVWSPSSISTATACSHYWVIKPADGPESRGECEYCKGRVALTRLSDTGLVPAPWRGHYMPGNPERSQSLVGTDTPKLEIPLHPPPQCT